MNLQTAVNRAVKASKLRPYSWAIRVGIPKSTFRSMMIDGTCSGMTLARLQKAGVKVASRQLIASLDKTAEPIQTESR